MTARIPAGRQRTQAMRQGRQADSARRRQRVITALDQATAAGTEISVSGIARTAGVDRTFLCRHRALLEKIHALQAAPPAGAATAGPGVTRASLQADLLAAHERACGSPPAPASSKNGSPKRSASNHGANQGSAHPPTSTP